MVRLVLAGVTVAMALVVAAPAQAALPSAPALPGQQTVNSATTTAASAVGAVQPRASNGVAAVQQAAPSVKPPAAKPPTVRPPTVKPPRVAVPHVAAPRVTPPATPRVTVPAPPAPIDTAPVERVGQALPDAPRPTVVGDAVALVGKTLPQIAPTTGPLLAPVQRLLGGLRSFGRFDFAGLVAAVSPGRAQTLGAMRGAPGAPFAAPPSGPAPRAYPAAATLPTQTFQAASARPPAAEVGGRPVSPPPRTAPAPVAGGATALFSSGGIFVPFLGLLVLAALAAPRLMRRLDELPAFVRPAPFLCALERPG